MKHAATIGILIVLAMFGTAVSSASARMTSHPGDSSGKGGIGASGSTSGSSSGSTSGSKSGSTSGSSGGSASGSKSGSGGGW